MTTETDDGIRHLAEPICATCGAGLKYDGGIPRPEDIVMCENLTCGNSATYAEVAVDCEGWYSEYMNFLQTSPSKGRIFGWKPNGQYRFVMKIVAIGQEEEFASCKPVRLNY